MTEKSEAEKLFWEREQLRTGIGRANERIGQIEQRLQEIANLERDRPAPPEETAETE